MTKIDIFSGFLGAGKTTLIKKLIKEAYSSEKVVLIENEFGEIGIDGGFLADAGIEITEMNSGCICCSLVGDFTKALARVLNDFSPDRIIIEPSGVGKLSDVIKAVRAVENENALINSYTAVADVNKCKMYMKNFGEFYNDQIKEAKAIVLSHTDVAKNGKVDEAIELIRKYNPNAVIVTTPWDQLCGKDILEAIEGVNTLEDDLKNLEDHHKHSLHEHHHEHGEECHCHDHEHHHEHGEECHCHNHEHHHEHGEECHCHDHEHHHEHGEECHCHDHEHHHEHGEECHCHDHHHHHADDVFNSVGIETVKKFAEEDIKNVLDQFSESDDYGMILRAKGIVASSDGRWIHFDYVPGEADIRYGSAGVIGRICVIGTDTNTEKIKELFGV